MHSENGKGISMKTGFVIQYTSGAFGAKDDRGVIYPTRERNDITVFASRKEAKSHIRIRSQKVVPVEYATVIVDNPPFWFVKLAD